MLMDNCVFREVVRVYVVSSYYLMIVDVPNSTITPAKITTR